MYMPMTHHRKVRTVAWRPKILLKKSLGGILQFKMEGVLYS